MSVATEPPNPGGEMLAGIEHLLVPLARLYLGPAVNNIPNEDGSKIPDDARLLQYALAKLVIEAGTLPPAGTPYAPHTTKFTVDDKGNATALDLPFVLAALRAGAGWAAAGPTSSSGIAAGPAPAPASSAEASTKFAPQPSARELRNGARSASLATNVTGASRAPVVDATRSFSMSSMSISPVRSGGCGCRSGGSAFSTRTNAFSSASTFSTATAARRAATAVTRGVQSGCDCGGSCGGRGCGCTDCIPRGAPAGDACSCGTCKPPPDPCTPWTPSCETRNRLRACLRDLFCELLLCVESAFCNNPNQTAAQRAAALQQCLADLVCKALRCVREALCPPVPPAQPTSSLPPMVDCLPCSYAVEDPR